MIGPSFYINGRNITFYLNKSTWQWHIGEHYEKPLLMLSKAKGEALIEFLEAMQKIPGDKGNLVIKKDPYSS